MLANFALYFGGSRERLGLVGTLLVLGLFLVLGYAGFRIAMRSDIRFCRF